MRSIYLLRLYLTRTLFTNSNSYSLTLGGKLMGFIFCSFGEFPDAILCRSPGASLVLLLSSSLSSSDSAPPYILLICILAVLISTVGGAVCWGGGEADSDSNSAGFVGWVCRGEGVECLGDLAGDWSGGMAGGEWAGGLSSARSFSIISSSDDDSSSSFSSSFRFKIKAGAHGLCSAETTDLFRDF